MDALDRGKDNSKGRIQRLALVSHDYSLRDVNGRWDYSADFHQINQFCDRQGCDTILYALYTWDTGVDSLRTVEDPFRGCKALQRVILEAGDLSANGEAPGPEDLHLQIWERGKEMRSFQQCFARPNEAEGCAPRLMATLEQRQVADSLVLICGEMNLLKVDLESGKLIDPFELGSWLEAHGINWILNPIHDFIAGSDMIQLRRFLSYTATNVASVWNRGRVGESEYPWMIFRLGDMLCPVPRDPFVTKIGGAELFVVELE